MQQAEGTATTEPTARAGKYRGLVEAAFQIIAHHGFDGLRTREVAAQVGITQATLHYYFPAKRDLVRAVIEYAVARIDAVRLLPQHHELQRPAAELRAHFAGILRQLRDAPDVFIVLDEIALLALRDESTAAILGESDQDWVDYLVDVLKRGVTAGQFAETLNPQDTAELIVAFFKGSVLRVGSQETNGKMAAQRAVTQLQNWIIQEETNYDH